MERVLSGRAPLDAPGRPPGDGGDSPAWSRKRGEFVADDVEPAPSRLRYAELHAHSAYSFLDGACLPEEMVAEARRLELTGLALTDHDGFYGVVRFAECKEPGEARDQKVWTEALAAVSA